MFCFVFFLQAYAFLSCVALKHVGVFEELGVNKTIFIRLCCFVPCVRLNLVEQQGLCYPSYLLQEWIVLYHCERCARETCESVLSAHEPHLGLLFFCPLVPLALSRWNSPSLASVDTAFSLAFISLSSRRRVLLLIQNQARTPPVVRVKDGVIVRCTLVEWISVVGPQCRMVRADAGKKNKQKPNNKQTLWCKQVLPQPPSSSSSSLFHSHIVVHALYHPCLHTKCLLGTYYPKYHLQCRVEVMCWLLCQGCKCNHF